MPPTCRRGEVEEGEYLGIDDVCAVHHVHGGEDADRLRELARAEGLGEHDDRRAREPGLDLNIIPVRAEEVVALPVGN